MGLLSRFLKREIKAANPLRWDMHNHILFGIDDGSKSVEQSLEMARLFLDLGYENIIATPHIMSDYYKNDRSTISAKQEALKMHFEMSGVGLRIDIAAEYYMDEVFSRMAAEKGDILCFDGKHVLVETSFLNKPMFFSQVMFGLLSAGYTPVLAHPERYVYFHDRYEEVEAVLNTGVKLQINLLSLDNYYSPMARKLAEWMISKGYYHYLGTDAHSTDHLQRLNKVFSSKAFSRIDMGKVRNAGKYQS